jgi:hypothetical protein
MRIRCLALGVWVACMTQATPAWAADPEVIYPAPVVNVYADLDYVRERGATGCPEVQRLRDAIMAHEGYDLFKPNSGVYVGRVRVVLSRVSGGFAGAYTWTDTEGVDHQGRFVQFSCKEAVDFVATALYIEFSSLETELGERYAKTTPPPYCPATPPQTAALESKTPPPCPDSRFSVWPTEWPIPPLEKPKPDPPKPLESWPIALRFNAALWPELIVSGQGSIGVSGGIGVRYHAISLDVEVHGDPDLGSQPSEFGNVSFWRISGDLLLCGHVGWFAGCGLGQAGRFIFPERIAPMPASAFYGALGVRTEVDFPLAPPRLFLSAAFDVLAPIHPANYLETGTTTTVFETAGPSVGFGLGLRAELPL